MSIDFDNELSKILSGLIDVPQPEPTPVVEEVPEAAPVVAEAPKPEVTQVCDTPKPRDPADALSALIADALAEDPEAAQAIDELKAEESGVCVTDTMEPDDGGPDVSDGTDAEGFPGGDERMGQDKPEPVIIESAPSPVFTTPPVTQVCEIPEFTSDELMEDIDIRNFATLVSLNTARWHGKVKDKDVAREAAKHQGADRAAYDVTKHLLVGCDAKLKRVHSAIDSARTKHYKMTLPWSKVGVMDKGKRAGGRLLPNTSFMEYTAAMAECKQEMEEALADFLPDYPQLIEEVKTKLSKSFKAEDYPHPNVIEEHFHLSFDFEPIPDGGGFQGLQDAQVSKLKASLAKRNRLALENAMQDAWMRMYEVVKHAAVTLGNPDAKFHYTLVDKLRAVASDMVHLNVTNDDRIELIRQGVQDKLCMHDVDDIKKDEALRKKLASDAKVILDKMNAINKGKANA